ncbi:MAG: hypothetical protein JGK24_07330 [Microcoleus sp. PH2017_29_MFU_D_A]|nr:MULTISPECIES: hypothetical protein [unclassified Microcoleus]MCC3431227.1 hypothetical protein [Microcoleus sp. PH2017_04_SCI_O_A]MCC3441064.1 hypothetical protein [Microcoleus sp. PH2017_03_ELD_O_A]MCC3504933.1 hypothetical protein [Microcoleus sp. PH2017_19_SFW_U_A]MCC3510324.1 hypothetical protein [Microcoleus sp. PH2017_17_BER_D_A]MCC3414530.1 hypothetical protein [Microcoleus sp. PH2017_02_FOX_O_A]
MSASSRSIARPIGNPIARPTHFPQINSPTLPNSTILAICRSPATAP